MPATDGTSQGQAHTVLLALQGMQVAGINA